MIYTIFLFRWLLDSGLPVSDLDATPELDVCIDGADEVHVCRFFHEMFIKPCIGGRKFHTD